VHGIAQSNSVLQLLRNEDWFGAGMPENTDQIGHVIVGLDLRPKASRRDHPNVLNGRLPRVLFPSPRRYDVAQALSLAAHLAAVIDPGRAWRQIERLMPAALPTLSTGLASAIQSYRTPEPVVRSLTFGSMRAKTELVEYGDGVAVRKTYRPSQKRFCEREVRARLALKHIPAIPETLAYGENWTLTPYYESDVNLDTRAGNLHLIPLRYARQVFESVRALHQEGYYLLDLGPGNVLVDRVRGVKFIDLEYIQKYSETVPPLSRSYTIANVPEEFQGDRPPAWEWIPTTYDRVWLPRIGLPFESLLDDPSAVQHLKRARYQVRRGAAALARRIRGQRETEQP
jgi:hypothetical protein